ncbi:MAG TPA: excinuclease ABC subunit UvrC [Solirubrobacterales bacterium]|jgi:excinuclease ABC subunit C|nr:excinuclease ABC subunit UvrC [Solirubrobacterales bacterium]
MAKELTEREQKLAEQRRELPDSPGVYLFRDRSGDALYAGKATSIRKRVASHFSGKGRGTGMGSTRELIDRIDSIETLVTNTEAEALLAEQSFIKRLRPRFNIRLRDDKSYPYVGISLDEEYPRVYFTRERHRPNRAYFGPFSSAKRVRETLDLLGKLFQYRTCEGREPGRRSGVPCLDYYIKRCQAPCVGYIDREEYRRNIDAIMAFLSGRYRDIEADLEASMAEAAEAQDFERAALFRDRLAAVQSLMERQRVAGGSLGSADVIGVAVDGTDANAQVFQVRDGVLAERHGFYLAGGEERDLGEVAEGFLLQYYSAAPAVPGRVVVGPELRGRTAVLEEALSSQRDSHVEVRVAARGDLRRLRELAVRNAELALAQDKLRREHRRQQRVETLSALQDAFGLERVPVRIEAFDISNLGETHTVASMVVFEGGAPKKSDYRQFNIRGDVAEGNGKPPPDASARRTGAGGGRASRRRPDDYAAMREVLSRRINRYLEQADLSPHDSERDASFAALPDLIVIDGGKGQLSAGLKALEPLTERGVTVISLAKRIEEIFLPGRKDPIRLERRSDGLRLLQRVRDEAHRFAITHHRSRRDKAMTASVLDGVRGVGPARKRALLRHFGSPERMLGASREELEAVPGVPGKLAREIHRQLNRAN